MVFDCETKAVVHAGTIRKTPQHTAVTGTLLHDINTDHDWSGAPMYSHLDNGTYQVVGMHIAGVTGLKFNLAASAYSILALRNSLA